MLKLLWKEWHEQAWKLAVFCIFFASLTLIGLRARVMPDDELLVFAGILATGFLPILVSSGLIPAERSHRSFETMVALPVPASSIYYAKTIIGLLLVVAPIALSLLIAIFYAGGREQSRGQISMLFIGVLAGAVSLLLWMIGLTAQQRSEARAAMVACGISLFWLIAIGGPPGLAKEDDVLYWLEVSPWNLSLHRLSQQRLSQWYVDPGTMTAPKLQTLFFIAMAIHLLIALVIWRFSLSSLHKLEDRP